MFNKAKHDMPTDTMQGVFPILITPFTEDEEIDIESLERLVAFNIQAGVHGLGIALASEIFKLNESERDIVIRTVIYQAGGRVPVVVNTGAASTRLTIQYSQRAQELGADAVMILPPQTSRSETLAYYKAVSNSIGVPIFIQDTPTASVNADLAYQIASMCEHVRYIKVESVPVTKQVSAMVDQANQLLTVFGGAGGGYFIEEMRRGAVGTMPHSSQPESFVRVWDLYQQGDEHAATEVFYREILPFRRIATEGDGLSVALHKILLHRRGIIASARVRSPAQPSLHPMAQRELNTLMDQLYPPS